MPVLRICVKTFILFVMEKISQASKKRLGRPLSFDRERALEAAMVQFWRTGYETTSVFELTQAMGITAPSLYTALETRKLSFSNAWKDTQILGRSPRQS